VRVTTTEERISSSHQHVAISHNKISDEQSR
jgi:hypothetical protein